MSSYCTSLRTPLLAIVMAALLAACAAPAPQSGIEWRPSPNFDARRPNLVVIHHTTDETAEEALGTLTNPERKVSSHYLVGRDGKVFQLVDEKDRAWHAGLSWWNGQSDVNSASIGIELDNTGSEPFPDVQIDALLVLLAEIKERNGIPTANFVGHSDVAPGRKVDPSDFFPWVALAAHGFGLWCAPPYPLAPDGFDSGLALAALGYNPSLPEASERAFRLHYMHDVGDQSLSEADDIQMAIAARDLLFCLVQQKATLGSD